MPDFPASALWEPDNLRALLKLALAASGTVVLAALSSGRLPARYRSLAESILKYLAVGAFATWWHLSLFPPALRIHHHEFFHYYLGAKYSPELGYTGLYDCVAAAEAESDPAPAIRHRWTRNLHTNVLEEGSPAARNPQLCRDRFSETRWKDFSRDVHWFKEQVSEESWGRVHADHGYNGSPVWNAFAYWLANTGSVSAAQINVIAWLDALLICGMWLLVLRAFGWQATAVAALWWGTNYPARYDFIGGAFLRSDWLVFAVSGICFAKLRYPILAGASLGWSALLRVFPAFIAGGAAARVVSPGAKERGIPELSRLAAGGILALAVLGGLSLFATGSLASGTAQWSGFVENSRKHIASGAVNKVSLKSIVSYVPGREASALSEFWIDGPGDVWQAVRDRAFAERRWIYWGVVAAFVVLLGLAVRNQPYWVSLVLGVGLIPMLADITCYYYGILLVYGFLWDRYPWTGVGLVALSTLSLLVLGVWSSPETRYTLISCGVIAYVFAVTAWVATQRGPDRSTGSELAG